MASRFHNLSDEQLADKIGYADLDAKAATEYLQELKDEFKARGVTSANGTEFKITRSEVDSVRLDTKRLKADFDCSTYELLSTATVLRIKSVNPVRRAA